LPVSRPAVSQHLKAAEEAGLVIDRPKERTRILHRCAVNGLGELRRWIDEFWDDALNRSSVKWSAENAP